VGPTALSGALLLAFVLAAVGAAPSGPADGTGVVRFEESAARLGVRFRHDNGRSEEKYMMETMGAGTAVFDLEGDGDLDLFFVNGGPLGGASRGPAASDALYRNTGQGRFEDITARAGLRESAYGMGVAVGDYDKDGDADLYVVNYGPNVLWRNNGDGTLTDVTAAAGVGDPGWGSSAVFFDAEGDGDLDLFVVNYCDASVTNNKWCGRPGREWRAYCTPKVYGAVPDVFYRNDGQGRFQEASAAVGLVDREGKGLGVVAFDADNDGDTDLAVANDSTPNQLWRNAGGRFTEIGLLSGIAYSEDGRAQAGMGIDAADYDGDGRADLVITNLDYETNSLLRNAGPAFVHAGYPAGIAAPSLGMVGFGVNWIDVENDGDLDLFVANGHIIDNIRMYNDTLTYAQPNQMFVNQGGGTFVQAPPAAGFAAPNVARGSATGDLDGDGRLDLVVSRNGEPAAIYLNRSVPAGHWLRVRTHGTASPRDGYGARVTLRAGGRTWSREVRATTSYQSCSAPEPHFGLGAAGSVESLTVRWPSGREEIFDPGGIDRVVTVVEGQGRRPAGAKP